MQGEKIMKNKLIKKLLVLGIAFSLAMSACASQNVQPADNDTDIEEDEDDVFFNRRFRRLFRA